MTLIWLREFMERTRKTGRLLAIPAFAAFGMSGAAGAGEGGAWPNLPLPTLGGMQFWADRRYHAGWRIQEHALTGHARLLDPDNVRRCWGSHAACTGELERIRSAGRAEPGFSHLVVLVHGLGRSPASFGGLKVALESDGYEVAAISYSSTRRSIARNAADLAELMENLEGVDRVSFVTHSLGGLVVRRLLARARDPWRSCMAVNALVMTAPPSQGSRMADILQYAPPVNLILWRGLFDARTKAVADLAAPDVPFGIVAAGNGRRGWNPLLAGDDDGIVSVTETRLDGAAGWMRVDGIHSFVMTHPATIGAVKHFLKYQRFPGPA